MYSFNELKKNLKKDTSSFKKVKLALLGDSATQFLTIGLRGYAPHYQLGLDIFEADFNQIDRQVFDPSSELYESNPEVVIIFNAAEKLLYKFQKATPADKETFADHYLQWVQEIYSTLTSRLNCKVIFYNLCEINNFVFGNYANKVSGSFIYQLRKINFGLMDVARQCGNMFICDVSSLQNLHGRSNVHASSIYINTDAVFSLDFIPHVANATMQIIAALQGRAAKCLVLDLDNTLWGGIIGDDGLENIQIGTLGIGKAFTEFQYWIKSLKERGIILTVCSKNTESVAREVFEKHPDSVLKMDDFAVFVANWENKADNIRQIQSILNIGFDSMVFLDDNPFERNMVRENIEGIIVPELPEDPADYLTFLYAHNLFETTSYSEQDKDRTANYQVEAQRVLAQKSFTDERSFLQSLNMLSDVQPFTKFNTPRVAQLSQRSNQFNLRTVRYTESDIEKIGNDDAYHTFSFTLEDKFGDNGLICVVILKKEDATTLFIDTWFMSCRVLKRGMENFVLDTLMNYARMHGYKQLKGEYIATAKNGMVKDHYHRLGFKEQNGYWLMDVADYKPAEFYIQTK